MRRFLFLFSLRFWPRLALVLGALVAGAVGCKGPMGRAYHNLAARDNAYFMARMKLQEVEATLLKSMVNDYNKTLPVFPPLTEATVTAVNADLEDIVKKASLPIARHKNSNWTDDAYLLIGKVRYYKMEYDEAEKVFKFVNTTGKEPNVRHAALIWLMRTFIVEKQIDNAVAVSDLLDKERGHPENARDLFLTRAQLAIIRNEPEKAIVNLRLAIPEVEGKNERSRLRFILGQLYQQQGLDKLANEQYRKILRRNPPYELDLFTKLNLSQVTELSDASGKAKIDKYLARLLKDPKNEEYRDKIYYEMARLEYRQQHYKKALENLTLSVRSSKSAQATQKPYSYLFAGQIYYDKLRNYRLAARYYDSTVQVMPTTAPEYPATSERRDILADFAKQIDIVERQDSLQEFARLDTTELNRRLAAMIKTELDRQEAEALKAAKLAEIAERSGPPPSDPTGGAFPGRTPGATPGGLADPTATATGGIWYFDNPATLGTARADFVRRWGNRTLQDNWRLTSLSQRNTAGGAGADKNGGLASGAQGDSAAAQGGKDGTAAEQSPEQVRAAAAAALRATLLRDLPKKPEDFQASDKLIEEALYQLARIYDERLHESEMAIERYEELLTRFPNTAHGPEALYALYLLAQRAKDTAGMQKYGGQLRQKYPKTEYAQLVDDPDFLQKQKLLNAKVHVLYDSAFALYRDGLYPKAAKVIVDARHQYPVNDISDKLALLDALIIGHGGKPAVYRAALEQIPTDYPASPLLPQVAALLAKITEFESGALTKVDATASADSAAKPAPTKPSHAPTSYVSTKAVPHAVMIVFPRDAVSFRGIDAKLANFNRANYSSDKLNINSLLFGDDKSLLLVKDFEDSRAAMNYAKRQRTSISPLAKITDVAYQVVVISLENLPAFYQARDLEEYQAFYRDNYGE